MRPLSQGGIILAMLRDGPKSTADFIGSPFGLAAEYRRAISGLRKKGYEFRVTRVTRSRFEYELVGEPESKKGDENRDKQNGAPA